MIYPGDVISNTYEIIEEIGMGGVGVIYLAYHHNLMKYVVIKKIKGDFVGYINERSEVDILKNLRHTYLPQVYDFIQDGNDVYTVMDYIEGRNLDYYIRQDYFFSEHELIRWLVQMCEVLKYLHSQKPPIIHSDIKPSNIMITVEGNVCLIDFNISFEEGSDVIGCSTAYASPEQYEKFRQAYSGGYGYSNIRLDERTDIYSLCASWYHMMTGVRPDVNNGFIDSIYNFNLPYSNALLAIIAKGMSYDIERRYSSADKMLKAITNIRMQDRNYRNLTYLSYAVRTLYPIIMIIAVVMILTGRNSVLYDKCVNEYIELQNMYEREEDGIESKAVKILTDYDYSYALEKDSSIRNNVMYILARRYMELKQYDKAYEYMKILYEAEPYNEDYKRNMSIVCVRLNNVDEALRIIDYGNYMGNNDSSWLVQAEIAYIKNELSDAVQYYQNALNNTENSEIIDICGKSLSEIYISQGNYVDCVETLKDIISRNTGSGCSLMRKYAECCIYCADSTDDKKTAEQYYASAEETYSMLLDKYNHAFPDYMNLSGVYQKQSKFESQKQILEEALRYYPDNYSIYLSFSLMEYYKQVSLSSSDRDYSGMTIYYKKTKELYDIYIDSGGENDERMNNLEDVYNELIKSGWIQEENV